MPLYLAFVDLTKAFDTVSREGLYLVLSKNRLSPKALESRKILPPEYERDSTI